jgi:hypothetical protein
MCDSGVNDKKVKAYKVTRADYPGASCTYSDGETLIDCEFNGAEIGDSIIVTLLEMTEEQLEMLPEFTGW